MKEKEVNLFTFINQIIYKSRKHPYDKKLANAYILLLWLSHDKEKGSIEKVNAINKYLFSLPDNVVYEYLMKEIPKGKRYISWKKKIKDEAFEKRVKKLQEIYPEMSSREARMTISFLQNKNVKEK